MQSKVNLSEMGYSPSLLIPMYGSRLIVIAQHDGKDFEDGRHSSDAEASVCLTPVAGST